MAGLGYDGYLQNQETLPIYAICPSEWVFSWNECLLPSTAEQFEHGPCGGLSP